MRELLVNRSLNPLLADLPSWVQDFRTHQRTAIHECLDAFSRVPVVVLDAPTGSGKTLIAETVRRMLRTRAVYICSTRSLQDQFTRDFDKAVPLKGRSNYATELYPERFDQEDRFSISADDCTWTKQAGVCNWCSFKVKCPYEVAKRAALAADLAVLNTSYFLTEANHVGRFSDAEFVIADEADTLEQQVMGYVSVEVSPGRMKRYGWGAPKVTVKDSWREWIEGKLPEVLDRRSRVRLDHTDLKMVREYKYLSNLYGRLSEVLAGLEEDYWVYTGRENSVSFRPSRVDAIGNDVLWRHGKKWLLMSATVISAEEMLDSLGYKGEYEVVKVPSTFPKEQRPIHVMSVANMNKKAYEIDKLLPSIKSIVRSNHRRILIHTVSYSLAERITTYLQELPEFSEEGRDWRTGELLVMDSNNQQSRLRHDDHSHIREDSGNGPSGCLHDLERSDSSWDADRPSLPSTTMYKSRSSGSSHPNREQGQDQENLLQTGSQANPREHLLPRSRQNMSQVPPRMEAQIGASNTISPQQPVFLPSVQTTCTGDVCTGLQGLKRQVFSYTTAAGRDSSLHEYCSVQGQGGVLVAPSMDRGIDLPGELCRVVVIAKVPYPYLGDRQVSARLHSRGGQTWYTVGTIRTLVQMCGRAMRSEEDQFTGYVLDSQFRDGLWSRGRGMFPSWFSEALVWK